MVNKNCGYLPYSQWVWSIQDSIVKCCWGFPSSIQNLQLALSAIEAYVVGPGPSALSDDDIEQVKALVELGHPRTEIARQFARSVRWYA